MFQVSHNQGDLHTAEKPVAPGDVDAWLRYQIHESVSWGGYWACLFVGGINYQTEHHVAPALEPLYYHFFARELRAICAKRGITYTYQPTYFHAVVQYHRWLSKMGNEEG